MGKKTILSKERQQLATVTQLKDTIVTSFHVMSFRCDPVLLRLYYAGLTLPT